TYYLLAGLPVSADWMSRPISPGLPAPNQYEKTDSRIRVRFGEGYEFNLRGDEKIEMLSELFLNVSPYYCALDKTTAEKHSSQIRFLHRQEIVNNTGPFFSDLKTNDLAVCLAPIKSGFLKHFPEAMTEPENYVAMRGRTPDGGLEWEFTLFGQKLVVPTEPKFSKAIIDSKLAIWPPKVSAQWHLYVAHGTGAGGRWLLVDENGEPGDNVELAADEYINILNKAGKPNRPLAIVLRDSSGNERGTLFLARLEEQQTAGLTASLAMDFGTSNTSLAFTVPGNVPSPMLFTLSPKMLWGAEPRLENPGFVPFDWGGRKGYFPSILLKRQMAGFEGVKPETLEARHLFAVDIPGLHANMESRVFDGTLHQTWPEIHKNLKWEHDPQHPWRRPAFLGLALLYAHAELFFRREATVRNYVFTFPLAFSEREQRGFREETAKVISRIRQLCFGDLSPTDLQMVDESTAIANSVGAEGGGSLLETFIDIGGGTTDLAIRHRNLYLLKDSVKVAGKSFFSFSEQNFHPAAKD
ncbi:MAG: hypothetical protein ACREEM_56200, partial [Blastocatellia bacterium]